MEVKPEKEFVPCAVLMEHWKISARAPKTSVPHQKLKSLGLGSIQKALSLEFLVEIAGSVQHLQWLVRFSLCLLSPVDRYFFALLLFPWFWQLQSIDLFLVSLWDPFLLGCQRSLSSCCAVWSHQVHPAFSPLSSAAKRRPFPANKGYAALAWPGGGDSMWFQGRRRLRSSLCYQLPGELHIMGPLRLWTWGVPQAGRRWGDRLTLAQAWGMWTLIIHLTNKRLDTSAGSASSTHTEGHSCTFVVRCCLFSPCKHNVERRGECAAAWCKP